ncbi:DUF6268 family outer membrane beta-barrel protein [Prevotella sp. 10(H)]|uniref:DUF6268 family outer membrane beta-barrel protein n=1 Tax=Prevotella sp. 10(H) TaxID=1158294 RepID=UPI0004A6BB2B|nr:DUF6268 family outer membrane beta-barrel protein [Prevotella sp. 10(H)]
MRFIFTFLFLTSVNIGINAQAYLKAEYIGRSNYKDIDGNKTGGKGDAKVISGGVMIPLSMKLNENNRPTAWRIGIGGSYTSFDNKDLPRNLCPSEIMNAQVSLMHIRPIREKLSILATLGVGTYTAHADISRIGMKNVLGHGGAILIWHLKDNLDLGGGLAINTSFGYPMAFPAFYFNWRLSGRYKVNVSMMDALEVSAGMQVHKNIELSVVGEMGGSAAMEKIDGKDMIFSHQYLTYGLRTEFKINKSFSIPVTVGMSSYRPAYYTERSLKAFFKSMNREEDPRFSQSFYVSTAIRYTF